MAKLLQPLGHSTRIPQPFCILNSIYFDSVIAGLQENVIYLQREGLQGLETDA